MAEDIGQIPVEEKPAGEAAPPPVATEPKFTRYEFGDMMPGVILIVPDQTPGAELIRIAATVSEQISLLVLRKTIAALVG